MNLTTSGLNTTKNNKIDKSFENLMSAFSNKKAEQINQKNIYSINKDNILLNNGENS